MVRPKSTSNRTVYEQQDYVSVIALITHHFPPCLSFSAKKRVITGSCVS